MDNRELLMEFNRKIQLIQTLAKDDLVQPKLIDSVIEDARIMVGKYPQYSILLIHVIDLREELRCNGYYP
jgi:hypothetical protein